MKSMPPMNHKNKDLTIMQNSSLKVAE